MDDVTNSKMEEVRRLMADGIARNRTEVAALVNFTEDDVSRIFHKLARAGYLRVNEDGGAGRPRSYIAATLPDESDASIADPADDLIRSALDWRPPAQPDLHPTDPALVRAIASLLSHLAGTERYSAALQDLADRMEGSVHAAP